MLSCQNNCVPLKNRYSLREYTHMLLAITIAIASYFMKSVVIRRFLSYKIVNGYANGCLWDFLNVTAAGGM